MCVSAVECVTLRLHPRSTAAVGLMMSFGGPEFNFRLKSPNLNECAATIAGFTLLVSIFSCCPALCSDHCNMPADSCVISLFKYHKRTTTILFCVMKTKLIFTYSTKLGRRGVQFY